MLVRILGISFEPKGPITLDELFGYLEQTADEQVDMGDINRLVIVDPVTNNDYCLGVIVTIKDQRRFCELSEEQGKMRIRVVNLEAHQSIMEFNFFIINKNTGFGLYQHYHQSCSIGQFAGLLSKRYRELAERAIQSEIDAIANPSETKRRAIRKKYAGRLEWQVLVRKENLENLLLELAKIKSFEFDFAHLEAHEPEYQPLGNFVRKERRRLSFVQNTVAQLIAHDISVLANNLPIIAGKVTGVDVDGFDRAIKILDNPDNFGEYQYDDVAAALNNLDLDAIANCWVIEELLKKAKEHKHIFEADTE